MGQNVEHGRATNLLIITSVLVADKPAPIEQKKVRIKPFSENIVFHFEANTNYKSSLARIRYKLDGYDTAWHEGGAWMYLAVRFFNETRDQIAQTMFRVQGESANWSGSLSNSPLTHRRETVTVPPRASRMMIVISSAGPASTEGIYAVANLSVVKNSDKSPPIELIHAPFDYQTVDSSNGAPVDWVRDGTHSSMAKIVGVGNDLGTKALAILDDDVASHAEWHNSFETYPKVAPGDNLVIEWNELYSMGVGDTVLAPYAELKPGNYTFHVQEVSIFGLPTGNEDSLMVIVPPPVWRTTWFWSLVFVGAMIVIIGATRYAIWHKVRREMLILRQQQALERERLRIAHDIHDDLGARLTQISLLSARSQENPVSMDKASADFERISQMSRDLVSALYETIWTVNPENDNLEALGNYLCQIVDELCASSPIRCRFHVQDLPRDIQVSSQIRHNISMAVKEAAHNAIKHSNGSEINVHVTFVGRLLSISVQDDGCGFDRTNGLAGHGLANMQRRLEDIGGHCYVETEPGKGTTVRIHFTIETAGKQL